MASCQSLCFFKGGDLVRQPSCFELPVCLFTARPGERWMGYVGLGASMGDPVRIERGGEIIPTIWGRGIFYHHMHIRNSIMLSYPRLISHSPQDDHGLGCCAESGADTDKQLESEGEGGLTMGRESVRSVDGYREITRIVCP